MLFAAHIVDRGSMLHVPGACGPGVCLRESSTKIYPYYYMYLHVPIVLRTEGFTAQTLFFRSGCCTAGVDDAVAPRYPLDTSMTRGIVVGCWFYARHPPWSYKACHVFWYCTRPPVLILLLKESYTIHYQGI